MALMPRYGEQLLYSDFIAEMQDDVVVASTIVRGTGGNITSPIEIGAVDSNSHHILELVGCIARPGR
jgi:hypothetical protein